jgi:hypothetical protein
VSLVVAACSDNNFSTEEPAYRRSVSEVPHYLAKYTCYAFEECSPSLSEIVFGANDCIGLLTTRFEQAMRANLEAAVDAGTMKFDDSKFDTCLGKIKALGCAALDNVYISACESAIGGTVELGEGCAFDGECKGDAYCKYEGSCPGTCSTREAVGNPCRDDTECEAGDKCYGGVCTPRLQAGEACTKDDVGCRSGYVCGPDAGSGRTCIAVGTLFSAPAGESCNILQTQFCEAGSYCAVTAVALDGATQSCIQQAESGGSCYFSYPDQCPGDQYCAETDVKASPPVIAGNCRPLPTQNQPCSGVDQIGRACAPEHVCVPTAAGSVCHKLQMNGNTCETSADCYSDNCSGGYCVQKGDCEVGAER